MSLERLRVLNLAAPHLETHFPPSLYSGTQVGLICMHKAAPSSLISSAMWISSYDPRLQLLVWIKNAAICKWSPWPRSCWKPSRSNTGNVLYSPSVSPGPDCCLLIQLPRATEFEAPGMMLRLPSLVILHPEPQLKHHFQFLKPA